jgi:Domain of unknown function (DUF4174)
VTAALRKASAAAYIQLMKRLIVILALLSAPAMAQDDVLAAWSADHTQVFDAALVDPAALLWLARPVVVFADSPNDPLFAEQMRLLQADLSELDIRDVIIIADTDPAAASPFRQMLRPRGFSVVLIDKDGRVNARKPDAVTVRELARQIDKMPLRLQEVRAGG